MFCVLRSMILIPHVLDFHVRFRRVVLLRVEDVCHVAAKLKQILSMILCSLYDADGRSYKSKGASITGYHPQMPKLQSHDITMHITFFSSFQLNAKVRMFPTSLLSAEQSLDD